MNVFVMHSFHHPSTWVPYFLATFCGNFLHVFVEFLPLTDPEAGDMKEAGTIFGAHCPNQVRLRDQDLRALRKVGIRMLRYVHTKDTSKIIDIDLYHNADPLVYSKNMQARDLLTPLPLRGAMKADTFVDSTNTNIAYRFLFRKKT